MHTHTAKRRAATPVAGSKTLRLALALVLGVGLLTLGACKDSRITLQALHDMEHELQQVEPVEVQPQQIALTDVHPYRVGPGDVLELTLIGLQDEYSQTQLRARINKDGRITLPLIGAVDVGGQDLQGVEATIVKHYVPDYAKAVSVYTEVINSEQTTVVVVGSAGEPGLIPLRRNQRNLLYALAASGSFVGGSAGKVTVRPIRSNREAQTYDLTDVNDLRRALLAPPLESGDMVVVDAAEPSAVYVIGLVNAPGLLPVPSNGTMSLVRAVAASGGLIDFLDPAEATLWRKLPDGRQVRAKLDLRDVLAGEAADVALRPGDVLEIPHTAETRVREWFAANVRLGPFGVTSMYDPVADRRARILANDNNSDLIKRSIFSAFSSEVADFVVPNLPSSVIR